MGMMRRTWQFTVISIIHLCTVTSLHAAPPLSVYGRLPGFESAAISPSGDHVALIGLIGDKRALIIVDKDNKPLITMGISDAKVLGLYWASDGMVLLQTSNTASLGMDFTADKAELQSMLVIPLSGDKPWSVFEHDDLIQGGIRGFHGLNERDGKWYGYFGGITLEWNGKVDPWLASTNPVLYEVDLQTHKPRKIARRSEDQEDYRGWEIGNDGQVRATFDFHSKDGTWNIINDRGQRIASGTDKLGNVGLVGFGSTPDTIIYKDQASDSDNYRWFEVPIGGGTAKEIFKDTYINDSFFDKRTRQLLGYELEGDTPAYHFFSAFQDKVMAATKKAFPNLSVHLVDWNDKFDMLIVKTEGVGDPGTWWTVDIRTGKADILGTSYSINAADVGPMKMIHYKAGDGMDIAAVLTLPPGRKAKNLPVVILPHGGPAARDYPDFDWLAQAFASRGYAVLQPNFRGSTGYGQDFERAGHGEWGRKMQTDVSDGLAQLVSDGIADPKRACIMGWSYGGYVALAGVTLQHGLYRCAVSMAGISDLQKMVISDIAISGHNQVLIRGFKDEVGSGRDLKAVSPIHFVDSVDVPVLLIHGKDDTVVLYDQSNDMANALHKAGKTVEFVTLPTGDHWLLQSAMRMTMLQAAVAFVQKYNPPDVTQ